MNDERWIMNGYKSCTSSHNVVVTQHTQHHHHQLQQQQQGGSMDASISTASNSRLSHHRPLLSYRLSSLSPYSNRFPSFLCHLQLPSRVVDSAHCSQLSMVVSEQFLDADQRSRCRQVPLYLHAEKKVTRFPRTQRHKHRYTCAS